MLHTDMHSAGFVVDPEYNFEVYSQESNGEAMSGFWNILEKHYPDCVEMQSLALQQLAQFRAKSGIFARDMVRAAATRMPAHAWWSTFGGSFHSCRVLLLNCSHRSALVFTVTYVAKKAIIKLTVFLLYCFSLVFWKAIPMTKVAWNCLLDSRHYNIVACVCFWVVNFMESTFMSWIY